jgi:hypothetical protein
MEYDEQRFGCCRVAKGVFGCVLDGFRAPLASGSLFLTFEGFRGVKVRGVKDCKPQFYGAFIAWARKRSAVN